MNIILPSMDPQRPGGSGSTVWACLKLPLLDHGEAQTTQASALLHVLVLYLI